MLFIVIKVDEKDKILKTINGYFYYINKNRSTSERKEISVLLD